MFLSIKNVPKVPWSSEKPLNFKPKLSWRPEDKKDINEDQFMIQEHLNNLFKN